MQILWHILWHFYVQSLIQTLSHLVPDYPLWSSVLQPQGAWEESKEPQHSKGRRTFPLSPPKISAQASPWLWTGNGQFIAQQRKSLGPLFHETSLCFKSSSFIVKMMRSSPGAEAAERNPPSLKTTACSGGSLKESLALHILLFRGLGHW